MKEHLFLLSRDCLSLARAEVERSLETKGFLKKNKLIISVNDSSVNDSSVNDSSNNHLSIVDLSNLSLGYTREVSEILFSEKELKLLLGAKNYDWGSLIKNSYSIEFEKGIFDEETKKVFFKIVWDSLNKLKKPVVDLKKADTKIKLYSDGEKIFVTKNLWTNSEKFEERKAHNRLYNHPTALHPKLARAMINLAGSSSKIKKIADPFCGSGGILIEGALMNKKMIGIDIDKVQIIRAKENLKSLNLKSEVSLGDALDFCEEVDAIISDLPYGKNSKVNNIDNTLRNFFNKITTCTKILVIGSEEKMNLPRLIGFEWVIVEEFSIYIHKTMTKKIFVLELVNKNN